MRRRAKALSCGRSSFIQRKDLGHNDESGVLIRVTAASVNPVDWKICKGLMTAVRPLHFPAVIGADVAGTGPWKYSRSIATRS